MMIRSGTLKKSQQLARLRTQCHSRCFAAGSATTRLAMYQLDAFASEPFRGNPAAVCPLEQWLPDPLLQAIANENNLSETAFFVPKPDGAFHLRWFTPSTEVDLCGHATLATAGLIFQKLEPERSQDLNFDTRSGRLSVKRGAEGSLTMDFPAWPVGDKADLTAIDALVKAMGKVPQVAYHIPPQHGAPYFLFEYANVAEVLALSPAISSLTANILVTAQVTNDGPEHDVAGADFVCRFFAPMSGVAEDPVTGSAHCVLAPYWSEKLGKTSLHSVQVSARRGHVLLDLTVPNRVALSGNCALFFEGMIHLPTVQE